MPRHPTVRAHARNHDAVTAARRRPPTTGPATLLDARTPVGDDAPEAVLVFLRVAGLVTTGRSGLGPNLGANRCEHRCTQRDLNSASRPVPRSGQPSAHSDEPRFEAYGSEGWEFESLRVRQQDRQSGPLGPYARSACSPDHIRGQRRQLLRVPAELRDARRSHRRRRLGLGLDRRRHRRRFRTVVRRRRARPWLLDDRRRHPDGAEERQHLESLQLHPLRLRPATGGSVWFGQVDTTGHLSSGHDLGVECDHKVTRVHEPLTDQQVKDLLTSSAWDPLFAR